MKLKEVKGKIIRDSRKEKTIQIDIKTEQGVFTASSPSGKSKGEYEKPYFMKKPHHDILMLKKYSGKLREYNFHLFRDLKKVETLLKGKVGSNTLFALETSILKALSAERGLNLWQVINSKARKLPFPVGNCIGGGLHSEEVKGKKPDFQEFLMIPKTDNFSDNVFLMKHALKKCGKELEVRKVLGKKNDENAFSTSLDNKQVLEIMRKVKEELEREIGEKIEIGIDVAASSFYTGFLYHYKNKEKKLKQREQINYILDLINKYNLDYVEDPLEENDFKGFNKLRYRVVRERPSCIVVGDDLTVSQLNRVRKALKMRSINALILKPNQVGSLIELDKVIKLAKEKGIKTVMSHRSGETLDYSLADLAFGFQTDYIKTGIGGEERQVKLKRMIEIEKKLR